MGAEEHIAPQTEVRIDPARQREVAAALREFMPEHAILFHDEDTRPYECDGLSAYRQLPMVVALPETEEQVARILRTCHEMKVPVVPRGAGTGLSGGALPSAEGVLLGMAKFNRILAVDPLAAPAERLQTQHRRDLLRRLHDLPPRTVGPQRASRDSMLVHEAPSSLHEGVLPHVVTGALSRVG